MAERMVELDEAIAQMDIGLAERKSDVRGASDFQDK